MPINSRVSQKLGSPRLVRHSQNENQNENLELRVVHAGHSPELAAGSRQLSSIISVHVCRQLVTDTKSLRAREGRKPIRSALRGRGSGGHWTGFPSPRLLQGGWVGGRLCGEGVGFGGASA